jgi:hypothetical protein
MLPTPEKEQFTDRKPENRNFNDLDGLLKELSQPKEQINSSQGQQPGGEPAAGNEHFTGASSPGYDFEPDEREPISGDIAAMSGKTIAGTIDTVLSTSMSIYARNSDPEKYQAKERQLEQLNNAWAAVAQKYNYKVEDSPWFNVILLTVAVYLPLMQEAKKDRRFAEMSERIDEMQKKYETLQNSVNELENKEKTKAA